VMREVAVARAGVRRRSGMTHGPSS
jgi:hypothetical protein